jgi:NADH:ubiquinone oxidoreductase subunit E
MGVTTLAMRDDTDRGSTIVHEILADAVPTQDQLLPVLLEVQRRLGHVPPTSTALIAHHFNLSRADVHGVASFYHDLRQEPCGRHRVQICQAEACQAVGCRALTRHAEQRLGVALGTTTHDASVTLEAAYCFGNCACGPTVRIGDEIYGRVSVARFDALLHDLGIAGRRQ